jgi:hypothetical protein
MHSSNWTTTKVPLWEEDLLHFWLTRRSFELRDVITKEHEERALEFARNRELKPRRIGTTIVFHFPETDK